MGYQMNVIRKLIVPGTRNVSAGSLPAPPSAGRVLDPGTAAQPLVIQAIPPTMLHHSKVQASDWTARSPPEQQRMLGADMCEARRYGNLDHQRHSFRAEGC